ncbi:lipopolysaccharide core biosynthesis protein [Salmonella enterica subsp. enterica]|nr:lipopolysaccharide core biosynthesis protein [Salmonella enterica subsp. enterica]
METLLLTTPVISTLKQNYPDAKIDVLLYQNTIPILSENPEINALYGISNKGAGTKEKIKNALSLIKKLRANSYDLVVQSHRSVERGAYCAFFKTQK